MSTSSAGHVSLDKVTWAGMLVSVGIVFGDIGTSPLYMFSAVFGERPVEADVAMGAFSAVFWTLVFQTTIKYIVITLRADNNGEGGIFSLYALVRKYGRSLLIPAIVGGSFLLADGIITPPISVSSAIEGLRFFEPELNTVPYVIAILIGLFAVQQFGTQWLGRFFGPIMLVWFSFMGVIGAVSLAGNPAVLEALNPAYAYRLITEIPGGFWLLGGVFLCTTGAEALYSDMGHCGRNNIRVSWAFVKVCLVLSYGGQCAWLIEHTGRPLELSAFYSIVPPSLLVFSIGLATLATIIASQALISGSFTLIGEAIRLNLWPKSRILYPTDYKGQLYVPGINWLLMAGCLGVVLYFRESKNMEAAFGLAVTLTMMMSTVLICAWLLMRGVNRVVAFGITAIFLTIESGFLVANLIKFPEGGWLSMGLGVILIYVMYSWYRARQIKNRLTVETPLAPFLPILKELSSDNSVPRYATNLVYLTSTADPSQIESRIIHSILNRGPKRADIYWFVHINVLDEPFAMRYQTEVLASQDVVWITFHLGFRIEPRINLLFRRVVEEMVRNNEISITSRYQSLEGNRINGDFRFVVMNHFLSYENEMAAADRLAMNSYLLLKRVSLSDEGSFGLDTSNVTVEKVPLVVAPLKLPPLVRETNPITNSTGERAS